MAPCIMDYGLLVDRGLFGYFGMGMYDFLRLL